MEGKEAMPPTYPRVILPSEDEPKKTKKWVFGLLFYAGAVTAALVTIAVLGSIYLHKVEHNCSQLQRSEPTEPTTGGNTKKYKYEDEEFDVDEEADKEIIKMTGDHYGTGSIVVHDFNKGVTGIYNAKSDECYLIGGIDEGVPSAKELSQQFESMSTTKRDNTTVHYGKTTDRPVKDLSLLPRELHDVCWGKDVYWLERLPEDGHKQHSSRQKRWTCPAGYVLVRYNTCSMYCCDFCVVYPSGWTECFGCYYIGWGCK